MGYDNYFEGGLDFENVASNINKFEGIMNLVIIGLLIIILIIVIVIASRKQSEKFRRLYIDRLKATKKGVQQSPCCATYNRATRVTDGAWSPIYDKNGKYIETEEMKEFKSRYLNQKVMEEIENTNNEIANSNTPFDNNQEDGSEIDKIVNEVKKEIENSATDVGNETVTPNGSIDPLDTKGVINNYIVGNMIDGNREPFVKNGPIDREEFSYMRNRGPCIMDPLLENKKKMVNTENFQPMDLQMRAYASKHGLKY